MHFRTRNSIILFFGIALLFIVALSLTSCGSQLTVAHEYPAAFNVHRIDPDTDLVYCADCYGNVWCFRGAGGWLLGDIVAAIVDSRGTDDICDDRIVSVRYAGSIAVG